MTVEILGPDATREHKNAENLSTALIATAPELTHPKVRLAIIPQVFAQGLEIDCVLVFEDTRAPEDMFRTSKNFPVQSFVACVEVKNHSPDAIRRHGTHLEVRYGGAWHSATAQADAQVWALKGVQQLAHFGKARRDNTFVQSVLWLPRVPADALDGVPTSGRTGIFYADLSWQQLVDGFKENIQQSKIQTLVSEGSGSRNHSYISLVKTLTATTDPTQLDLMRVNALTQKRFDVDKQAYVRELGSGLLMFRGRAGTGKPLS